MNRSDTHLSTEALAAYVDGELAPGPHARAAEHIASCLECGFAVGIQAQTKESLSSSSGTFAVPSGLLAKLGKIPYDVELPHDRPTASGMSMTGSGVFEFSVAAPATTREPESTTAHPSEPAKRSRLSEMRRARHFNRGAALIALGVGLTLSPTMLGGNGHIVSTNDEMPTPSSIVGVVSGQSGAPTARR